jgi:putative spermidine/putrescine transport system ATP-binding protein
MREELREIQSKTGLTMVFVTHDQEEALSISDRIVVMNKGKIEQIATPQEIYDQPNTLFVAQFIGKMNFLKGVAQGEKLRMDQLEFPNDQNLSGEVVVAVRPEDVVIQNEGAGLSGTIKQIMILGHYAEITVEVANSTIKAFLSRETLKDLRIGQEKRITFSKVLAYLPD